MGEEISTKQNDYMEEIIIQAGSKCPLCGVDLATSSHTSENCPKCESRPRSRALCYALEQIKRENLVKSVEKPVLCFSMTDVEKRQLAKIADKFTSVSLYGHYGSEHLTGVDARDLHQFPNESFGGYFANLLFDYFEEHEAALREAYRVLTPSGFLLTHIAAFRLSNDSAPPKATYNIGHEKWDYIPEGKHVVSVKLGLNWFLDTMSVVGFNVTLIHIDDPISKHTRLTWILGQKKADIAATVTALGEDVDKKLIWEAPTVINAGSICPVCSRLLRPEAETSENCAECGSRTRIRALSHVLELIEQSGLPLKKNGIFLSKEATSMEQRVLSRISGRFIHRQVSEIDLRDLSIFYDNTFTYAYSSLAYDRFLEQKKALEEAYRVLEPGGLFMAHMASGYLLNGLSEPKLANPNNPESCVKVGLDWFVQAMRDVGFVTTYVQVKDPLSSRMPTWFLGEKPTTEAGLDDNEKERLIQESIKTCIKHRKPEISRIEPFFNTKISFQSRTFEISMEKITLPCAPNLALCEAGSRLLAKSSRMLWQSTDAGESWEVLAPLNVEYISHAFSLKDGSTLVAADDSHILHLAPDGGVINKYSDQRYHPWHGSQGIGQSTSGVVMFAEYPRNSGEYPLGTAFPLNVWRLQPDKNCWESVLSQVGAINPSVGQDIRHFHICAPTGLKPGQWLVSSGDVSSQIRLWISNDDGDNWREININESCLFYIPSEEKQRVARFTSFSTTSQGSLIWGIDDTVSYQDSRVSLLMMAHPKKRWLEFHKIGTLGLNASRNIINLGNDLFLTISESKYDILGIYFHLIDMQSGEINRFQLPNSTRIPQTVTLSIASLGTDSGWFYFEADGKNLLAPGKGFIRGKVIIL